MRCEMRCERRCERGKKEERGKGIGMHSKREPTHRRMVGIKNHNPIFQKTRRLQNVEWRSSISICGDRNP